MNSIECGHIVSSINSISRFHVLVQIRNITSTAQRMHAHPLIVGVDVVEIFAPILYREKEEKKRILICIFVLSQRIMSREEQHGGPIASQTQPFADVGILLAALDIALGTQR